MNWLKKIFSNDNKIEEKKSFISQNVTPTYDRITIGFTVWKVVGLVLNLKEEDWKNSEHEPLTDKEKEYILSIIKEKQGKILSGSERNDLVREHTPSCEADRPELFLGWFILTKSKRGVMQGTKDKIDYLEIPKDGSGILKTTDEKVILEIIKRYELNKLD